MSKSLSVFAAAALLSGCAAFNQLTSDVSTHSQWPVERKPGSYAFERLPSQLAQPQTQQKLEEAARPAIEAAGFGPEAQADAADYVVQLNARVDADRYGLYDDPFWWRGSYFYGRHGFRGPGFGLGFGMATPMYDREVALLVRDRRSGKPLFETRASNSGGSPSIDSLLPAMFEAAMKDFPTAGVNPRKVTTEIEKK